jgi:hypothetical protein
MAQRDEAGRDFVGIARDGRPSREAASRLLHGMATGPDSALANRRMSY